MRFASQRNRNARAVLICLFIHRMQASLIMAICTLSVPHPQSASKAARCGSPTPRPGLPKRISPKNFLSPSRASNLIHSGRKLSPRLLRCLPHLRLLLPFPEFSLRNLTLGVLLSRAWNRSHRICGGEEARAL